MGAKQGFYGMYGKIKSIIKNQMDSRNFSISFPFFVCFVKSGQAAKKHLKQVQIKVGFSVCKFQALWLANLQFIAIW